MKFRRPAFASHHHTAASRTGSPASLAILLVILSSVLAIPLILLLACAPRPLVLPLFGMTALALAATFACLAWWHGIDWKADHVTTWDVAGALTFIGFAAVLLSEPETVLPLLGQH